MAVPVDALGGQALGIVGNAVDDTTLHNHSGGDGAGVRRRITAPTREVAEDLLADKIRESRQVVPGAADREITLATYEGRRDKGPG